MRLKPNLSNEGLRIWQRNLDILIEEFEKHTNLKADSVDAKTVLEWSKNNVDKLKDKLHPDTVLFKSDKERDSMKILPATLDEEKEEEKEIKE